MGEKDLRVVATEDAVRGLRDDFDGSFPIGKKDPCCGEPVHALGMAEGASRLTGDDGPSQPLGIAGSSHLFLSTLFVSSGPIDVLSLRLGDFGWPKGNSAGRLVAWGEGPDSKGWLNFVLSRGGGMGGILGGFGAAAAKKRLAENEARRGLSSLAPMASVPV